MAWQMILLASAIPTSFQIAFCPAPGHACERSQLSATFQLPKGFGRLAQELGAIGSPKTLPAEVLWITNASFDQRLVLLEGALFLKIAQRGRHGMQLRLNLNKVKR